MQIIGFNLTKITAEKQPDFKFNNLNINIKFTDLKKEKIELLKENQAFKIDFNFSIIYEDKENKDLKKGEIVFVGNFLIATEKDEAKKIEKTWKNKRFPHEINEFLINFIFQKCAPKALVLEEDIQLPFHIKIPLLKMQKEE